MPHFLEFAILFIHIPKTGGSSINKYYFNLIGITDLYSITSADPYLFGNSPVLTHSLQHSTFQEIISLRDINKIQTIFTIVRNPFDRLVSAFLFNAKPDISLKLSQLKKCFSDFLKLFLNRKNFYDNHNLCQYEFLISNDDLIDKRIKIYRFENLNTDFPNLPHVYQSNSVYKYHQYYDNETIEITVNYYKKDFEFFNYPIILSSQP